MAFFDALKQSITGRPLNIKGPTFIRDECDAQMQIEKMEALMPETYEQLMQIKGFADVKCSKYGDAIISIVKKFR